jgi:hypothetical protein
MESLSRAWCKIDLDFSSMSLHTLTILQTVLKHSGSTSLSIFIAASGDGFTLGPSHELLLQELFTRADRWHDFRIGLPLHKRTVQTKLQSLTSGFPSLHTLCTYSGHKTLPSYIFDVFGRAKALQHVYVYGLGWYGHIDSSTIDAWSLPWSQITHFECSLATGPDAELHIFSKLSNLTETAFIGPWKGWESYIASMQPTELPLVRKVKISSTHLLPALRLPALLDVECDVGLERDHLTQLRSLISDSKCELQHLKLQNIDAEIVSFLQNCTPSLISFEVTTNLDKVDLCRKLVKGLTVQKKATSPVIVPRLKSLSIVVNFTRDQDIESVAKMAESRWHPPNGAAVQLKEFSVGNEHGKRSFKNHPILIRLSDEGLCYRWIG